MTQEDLISYQYTINALMPVVVIKAYFQLKASRKFNIVFFRFIAPGGQAASSEVVV
jgi:hypothetical protein